MGSAGERASGARARPADRLAMRVPADPDQLRPLRQRLCAFLAAHRVGEQDTFDLAVAVSEAVANAIEHPVRRADALIDVTVEVRRQRAVPATAAPATAAPATAPGREIVVTVRDNGHWRPSSADPPSDCAADGGAAAPPPGASAARGRGLLLIGALTDAEVRTAADGTTLTLRRRLTTAGPAA